MARHSRQVVSTERGQPRTLLQGEQAQGPVQVQTTHAQIHQGPLPAPQDLAAYDALLPGTADRIIAMAEREQAIRHNLEDQAQRADIQHRQELVAAQRANARGVFVSDMAGQILGWLIASGCVAGAIYATYVGAHPTIPIAFLGLPVASIIKAFRNNSAGSRSSDQKK